MSENLNHQDILSLVKRDQVAQKGWDEPHAIVLRFSGDIEDTWRCYPDFESALKGIIDLLYPSMNNERDVSDDTPHIKTSHVETSTTDPEGDDGYFLDQINHCVQVTDLKDIHITLSFENVDIARRIYDALAT